MRRGNIIRLLLGSASCVLIIGGCSPDRSERRAIEAAIERSDSLRRRPGSPGTRAIPSDIPVAQTIDPDSVALVPINYALPPEPKGPWVYDVMPGDSGYPLPQKVHVRVMK